MGEAKRKRESFKALAIKQMERWDFPATEAEAQAVTEIEKLPVITVQRYPAHIIKQMGMPPNECHANARFMVNNDPEGKCRQISGYWPQAGNYVLHSVVERDGEVFCVTPLQIKGPDRFQFIPDPDLEWKEEGGYMVAYRKGLAVEPGFRRDPAENKRIQEIILARIEAGMHPLQAGEPPF